MRPFHFLLVALAGLSAVVLIRDSERSEFEDEARSLVPSACADAVDPGGCESAAGLEHERCFTAAFHPGRSGRADRQPPRLDRRAYGACVTKGFDAWNAARRKRARDQRDFEREIMQ